MVRLFLSPAEAILWIKGGEPIAKKARREAMISQIEAGDKLMRESGLAADWFAMADAEVRRVADGANGEIFAQLSDVSGFVDNGAVPILREGVFRNSSVVRAVVVFSQAPK